MSKPSYCSEVNPQAECLPPGLVGALDVLERGLAPVLLRPVGDQIWRDGKPHICSGKEP